MWRFLVVVITCQAPLVKNISVAVNYRNAIILPCKFNCGVTTAIIYKNNLKTRYTNMNKGLKLALVALAVAGTPVLSIAAEDAAAAKAEQVKAAATQVELKDGTKVQIEGENVSVIAADGVVTPAPDGAHVTKDGKTINTKGGKIVK